MPVFVNDPLNFLYNLETVDLLIGTGAIFSPLPEQELS